MNILKTLISTVLSITALTASAQAWPTRQVTIVTNMSVGSNPDVIIRKYANELTKKWGQSVVVENRPGASGAVALDHYVNNVRDSHTIYIGDAVNFTAMPFLYNRENLLSEVTPVALMYRNPWVVVASSKYRSPQEAVEKFKQTPTFGSWAVGSVGQLCGNELSSILTSSSGLHIAYKEYSQWFTDIINQNVVLSCTTFGSSMPYYQGKKLQYIAVTGNKRHPFYPELPTLNELLKQNIVVPDGWVGVFVKKSTEPALVAKLESDFLEAAVSDEIKKTLESSALLNTSTMNAKDFSKFLKTSTQEYKYLIKKFNVTVN